MEFLKKNYEKVVLGVVLLGLTVAVGMLPFILSSKREQLKEITDSLTHPRVKPLPPVDIAMEDAVLKQVQSVYKLDFTHSHKLFNPVLWQKDASGRPIKVSEGPATGPEAMEITDIKPLYLQLAYNSMSGNSYLVGVQNEAAAKGKNTGEKLAQLNKKNDLFELKEVKGPPENPELVLQLNDGITVSIATNKPYKRVEGYAADLKFPPDNKTWRAQRVGANLNFAGGQYNIVAITPTNVILLFKPNEKKTTINFRNAVMP